MNHNQKEKIEEEWFKLGYHDTDVPVEYSKFKKEWNAFDKGFRFAKVDGWNWINQALIQARADGFTHGMNQGYIERSKDLPKSYQKGRADFIKELENHIDKYVSLQENNAGMNQEDALNLRMGIEGFLLSFKLKDRKKC